MRNALGTASFCARLAPVSRLGCSVAARSASYLLGRARPTCAGLAAGLAVGGRDDVEALVFGVEDDHGLAVFELLDDVADFLLQ